MIRVAGCVAVAASALAFSGCNAHGDRDKVERQLFEEVPALIGKKIVEKSVVCPDDLEAKRGARYTCSFLVDQGTDSYPYITLDLTMLDGGKAQWNFPSPPVVCPSPAASAKQKPAPAPPPPVAMHRVPAGSVTFAADKPYAQTVEVAAFEIDETEVTVAAYADCERQGKCRRAGRDREAAGGYDCTADKPGFENHPITCVDWTQGAEYCAFVGKRLPLSAEWMRAAQGEDGRDIGWDDAAADAVPCWERDAHDRSGGPYTCAVGTRARDKSPFGLFDVAGNVTEWADGWSDDAHTRRGACGCSWQCEREPTWLAFADRCTAGREGKAGVEIGFRCARTAP